MWNKIHYTFRLFSNEERIVLAVLGLLAIIGFFGALDAFNSRYSYETPSPGGSWKEGLVGSPHFVNPLFAISDPDRDLVSLVFSGLMRPDGEDRLIPDLAQSYEISPDGLSYTFTLKPEARFHDGEKVSADDILFTVGLAKSPALKSPLRANWEGVEVEKIDGGHIRFTLRRPYAAFLENAALGILPKHIWKDLDPEQMSLSNFNLRAIGAGPFKVESVGTENNGIVSSYTLKSFPGYVLGEPYIRKIFLKFYPSEVELLNAYELGSVDAIGAISPHNIKKITRTGGIFKTLTLPRVFGIFFNQNEKSLFVEKEVREALNLSSDKNTIVREVLRGYALPLSSPIPPGTFGALESTSEYNPEKARQILEKAGWVKNAQTGLYEKIEKKKVKKELAFSISTSNAPDLIRSADILKQNWEKLGAKVEIKVFEISDLNQNVIRPRRYDALLFGEVVGRDPDPFAFWHSSQRNDPGLNIALYTNRTVDKLLEEARGLSSPDERRKRYEQFQQEIAKDTPAVFLYSPYFIYAVPENLKGFSTEHITTPSERFANIYQWHFETAYVWKIFKPE